MALDLAEQPALLLLVDRFHRTQQLRLEAFGLGAAAQGLQVLGEARAAKTAAGIDEVVADARVRADATAHHFDVGAQVLGQVGDFVDEGNLGGQHAIGCVLGQLGTARVHDHELFAVAVERQVKLA
ncbi:hypothetical protein D3C75_887150 [compost metagenome]